jgi:hypothetical protein
VPNFLLLRFVRSGRALMHLPARCPHAPACRYGGALERALKHLGAKPKDAVTQGNSHAQAQRQSQQAGEAAFK